MKLNNKKILLTGASGGIGRELAAALDAAGARICLAGRNEQKLMALKDSLPHASRHFCLAVDLTQDDDLERLNQAGLQYQKEGQGFDIVINNAGANQFACLTDRSMQSVRDELNLNLTAPVLVSKLACGWLNRPGIILNIGSTFGGIGYPGYSVYCAAKSGVYRFSEALDRELYGSGVRALYIAPRATETSLNSPEVQAMNQDLKNQSDSPQLVAKMVVDSLEQERAVRWIGWPEKLFVRVNQILPGVVAGSIQKQHAKIMSYLKK
ncbi:3-oxoacyl-[acyl-carrier-protein] reductase FabG [Vibrio aerogenes CECT 7868]|uniref:3-oxoacyl-[acyl-carrier-protein] reductase FabG n=1 Tax=Vibrio aerogenes CECT 7868 TaxID=1216006 RepID=A0A1M5V405_9VIBR|nr:SDR family oxidoreductase [Vibrio aerogenes]SHH69936.1 3-oxoacyl-[acyl-carrier-protein] reductase FabG [Vibrio aerogenes CECT 7868]